MPKHIRDKALGIGDFHMKTRLSSQRLRMTDDQQLIDYLLLLRFGTSDVGQAAQTRAQLRLHLQSREEAGINYQRSYQAWH